MFACGSLDRISPADVSEDQPPLAVMAGFDPGHPRVPIRDRGQPRSVIFNPHGPRSRFGSPSKPSGVDGWVKPGHDGPSSERKSRRPCRAPRSRKSSASSSLILADSTRPSSSNGYRPKYRQQRSSTFTADPGQGKELEPREKKAELLGVKPAEHLHRGPARGIRARLCVPDVPRQRPLRGPISARHLDRATADRKASGRDRSEDGGRRHRARRDRQGQRSGAL